MKHFLIHKSRQIFVDILRKTLKLEVLSIWRNLLIKKFFFNKKNVLRKIRNFFISSNDSIVYGLATIRSQCRFDIVIPTDIKLNEAIRAQKVYSIQVSRNEQIIIFNGKSLNNYDSLKSYGIANNSNLTIC
jgi:hypothetical protein